MATIAEAIRAYTTDKGAIKCWDWGRCDCIGLMFELVRKFADCPTTRDDYLPPDIGYAEAVKWVADRHSDPLLPYQLVLENDAGLKPPKDGEQPHIILMHGGEDLITNRGNAYPLSPIPGLAFQPEGMRNPYVFGKYGLEQVTIKRNSIGVCHEYRLPRTRI